VLPCWLCHWRVFCLQDAWWPVCRAWCLSGWDVIVTGLTSSDAAPALDVGVRLVAGCSMHNSSMAAETCALAVTALVSSCGVISYSLPLSTCVQSVVAACCGFTRSLQAADKNF
jgi:hypothetical protein